MKILITSVGSRVGQSILDALEGRRAGVQVIGTNSLAEAAGNFACDVCYLAPKAAEEMKYRARLLEIIESERPDLILAGRDDDVIALAAIREQHPRHAGSIVCGSLDAARIMDDKFLTYDFARKHDLPFADTSGGDERELRALVARRGYPLIAKPRRGHASQGVLLIRNEEQLARAATLPDYVFQEYIDPPSGLDAVLPDLAFGLPLFFSMPDLWQFSLAGLIAPTGEVVDDFFCVVSRQVSGRPVQHKPVDDPALIEALRRYALALAGIGWVGPFNMQGRSAADGRFVAFELNGRLTGSTSGRLRLGFDQVGAVAQLFAGAPRLAPSPLLGTSRQTVFLSPSDFVVRHEDTLTLQEHGVWRKIL